MLIDAFASGWLDELHARAATIPPPNHLYVLVDGAFVPGVHEILPRERKAILYESLPGCSAQALEVSPFLVQFDPADRKLRSLLRRCDKWPMLSVIETPESLEQLTRRLAVWCVVQADGQHFNFRFSDTRRLPAIVHTLSNSQREQFTGPAERWAYVGRDGGWREIQMVNSNAGPASDPQFDDRQFAALVDDSLADELMVLLSDRGHDVFRYPSRSHALLSSAVRAAQVGKLSEDNLFEWCVWFWEKDPLCEVAVVEDMLRMWRNTLS